MTDDDGEFSNLIGQGVLVGFQGQFMFILMLTFVSIAMAPFFFTGTCIFDINCKQLIFSGRSLPALGKFSLSCKSLQYFVLRNNTF